MATYNNQNKKRNQKQKRNTNPEELWVLGLNDLLAVGSLNEKEEALVENRFSIFIHNLEYLLNKKGFTQNRFCEELLMGSPQAPQLTGYKEVGKDIPFRTIARIAIALGVSPEAMISQKLDEMDTQIHTGNKTSPRPAEEYRKYLGTYHMAYFATDARLGANRRTTARAMAEGIMTVFYGNANDGAPTLEVLAFTNCSEEERKKLLEMVREAERKSNTREIRKAYESVAEVKLPGSNDMPRMKCFYKGHMRLTDRIAEITLYQAKGSDVIHLQMHNRAAISSEGSEYKGGLATMMSTSRGEEHMPCIQAIALSKRGITIAKEELAKYLFMAPPTVDLQGEVKTIVAYMKSMYRPENADDPVCQLSDMDKERAVEIFIERKLSEVIKRNICGYYKVSTEMDSTLYKAVCRDQ